MAEETSQRVYAVAAELIDEDADTYYVVVTESVSAEEYERRMEEAKAAGVRFESAERRSTCFRLAKANVYGLVFLTRAERKLTR